MRIPALALLFPVVAACQPLPEPGHIRTDGKETSIVGGAAYSGLPGVGALAFGDSIACTATLITPTRVLTAAHCVTGDTTGMTFVTGPSMTAVESRTRISRAVAHPRYNDATLENDIAYIDLESAPPVAPVAVVRSMDSSWVGRPLLHVGYGANNGVTQTGYGTKRAVTMLIDNISATQFRYGGGGTNTCNGDSGGPALFQGGDGSYAIAGVTSYGDENCTMYGADTRADVYLDFLGVTGAAPAPPGTTPVPAMPEPVPEPGDPVPGDAPPGDPPPAEPVPGDPLPGDAPPPPGPGPAGTTSETLSDGEVFLFAGEGIYYDALPVRPGTSFRAMLRGVGDADLYVRFGAAPTATEYACRPFAEHSNETCDLIVPAGVTEAYVAVEAYFESFIWLDIHFQY